MSGAIRVIGRQRDVAASCDLGEAGCEVRKKGASRNVDVGYAEERSP